MQKVNIKLSNPVEHFVILGLQQRKPAWHCGSEAGPKFLGIPLILCFLRLLSAYLYRELTATSSIAKGIC